MAGNGPKSLALAILGVALYVCISGCAGGVSDTPRLQDSTLAGKHRDAARELIDTSPDDARRLLEAAIAADPFDARAYNNLGVLLFRQGEYRQALERFVTARRLDPSNRAIAMNVELTRSALDANRSQPQ